ncbi:NUDIX domain-containing protein [Euryarchaeota archaeon]|jgi:ADP-ribose pyrophosphatase YjhB (NUDIX family)|nr:NUDIX domain-containing protein [Euryarchaeota archaeon]|tara:strand:- start:3707 stop:4198 length:492 start_codon:yes stop_codon:yes gene_type:complete
MHNVECDLGVAAIVRRARSILLVRELHGRYQGRWGLPKGYVDAGELPRNAALRELREECGVEGNVLGVQSVRERLLEGTPAIFIAYMVEIAKDAQPIPNEEVSEALFVPVDQFSKLEWISDAMQTMAVNAVNSKHRLSSVDYEAARGHPYVLHTLPESRGGIL